MLAVTSDPLRFCAEHQREAAEALAHLTGRATLEHWLNAGGSTRRHQFGSAIARREQPGSVVYFMRRERMIKIGFTGNLRHRAVSLNATVLAHFPGGRAEEAELHRRFAGLRRYGEWFEPGRELLDYINECRRATGRPSLAH
jgi:hypothetical protein